MARKVDITEKLSFDSNPTLIIRNQEIVIKADAPTVFKIMDIIGNGNNTTPADIAKVYEYIFMPETKKQIEELGLNFSDLMIVIEEAIQLVIGNEIPITR